MQWWNSNLLYCPHPLRVGNIEMPPFRSWNTPILLGNKFPVQKLLIFAINFYYLNKIKKLLWGSSYFANSCKINKISSSFFFSWGLISRSSSNDFLKYSFAISYFLHKNYEINSKPSVSLSSYRAALLFILIDCSKLKRGTFFSRNNRATLKIPIIFFIFEKINKKIFFNC